MKLKASAVKEGNGGAATENRNVKIAKSLNNGFKRAKPFKKTNWRVWKKECKIPTIAKRRGEDRP